MKNQFLVVLGIVLGGILFYSCSSSSDEIGAVGESVSQSEDGLTESDDEIVTLIDGHLPENLRDSIWVFYHAVQDEVDIVGNTQDLFIGCEERDENNPLNCDSLVIQIAAGVERIKNMDQPGNQPELFVNETIEVMLDFSDLLESFTEKEHLVSATPKNEWTTEEIEFWNDFYNGRFDSSFELWNVWRNDAGMNYMRANEEHVGPV